MKTLMVTPYPPNRDGIAVYAAQDVKARRAAGEEVEVLSPGPSAAHYHLDLVGPRGALALAKRVPAYDKVVVQFHPDFFYPVPCPPGERIKISLALLGAFRRARSTEVVVHEIDYRHGRGGAVGAATRAMWRSVDQIVVHTAGERDAFAEAFGVPRERIKVAAHGASFHRNTGHTRASARESLGLAPDVFTFLTIGFIQPHKGFDRAVRAFSGLAPKGARLDLVGSVRTDDAGYLGYLGELRAIVEATAGAHLHAGYVSDELFDRWLVAADVVVLPYRSIWSSGVLERASLYDRPVIATAVGGLPEQASSLAAVTLVKSDEELREAMWTAAAATLPQVPRKPWPVEGEQLRERVQAEVRSRAAAERGSKLVVDADPAGARRAAEINAVTAALRRLPRAQLPPVESDQLGMGLVKRTVRKLTGWEVAPITDQIDQLRWATVSSLESLASEEAHSQTTTEQERP